MLLEPAVTSFVPSGVYAQRVVPGVCAGRGRGREAMKDAMLSIGGLDVVFDHAVLVLSISGCWWFVFGVVPVACPNGHWGCCGGRKLVFPGAKGDASTRDDPRFHLLFAFWCPTVRPIPRSGCCKWPAS